MLKVGKMRSCSLLGTLLIFLLSESSFGQDAQFTCFFNSATSELTMTIRKQYVADTAERLVAINTADINNANRTCISFEDPVGADTYLEINITTDMSKTQTSPDPATNDCFVVDDGDTVVSYNILQESTSTVISAGDLYYAFSCNSSNSSGDPATISAQNVTVLLNLLTENNPVESGYSVSARLMDSFTEAEITGSVDLDTLVYIELTFTRDVLPEIPLFLQVTKLEVSGDPSFSSSVIIMLDENGCPFSATGPFSITNGVSVSNSGGINAGSPSVVGNTGDFFISIFTSSSQIYFRIQWVAPCFSNTDERCFDAPTYCTSLGRRKRQAEEEPISGTVEFSVDVSLFGNANTGNYDRGVPLVESKEVCSDEKSFWIVSIVLGVLLMVVLAFAVILFYKLRKEKGTKMVDEGRFGVKNPSI